MDAKASKWGLARSLPPLAPAVRGTISTRIYPRKRDGSPVPNYEQTERVVLTAPPPGESFLLATSEIPPFRRNSPFWSFLFNRIGEFVERTILDRRPLLARRRSAQS